MARIYDIAQAKGNIIHFTGIGGIGMSAIARVLHHRGFSVTGSDVCPGPVVDKLRSEGIHVAPDQVAENIHEKMIVVYTSAAGDDNPEVAEARRLGLPLLKRAEILALILNPSTGITVAGTHGKTTTSAMAAMMMERGGLSPCALVGGEITGLGTNVLLGDSEFCVIEADESDGSFLFYKPRYSIITNIEPEHMEHFGSEQRLKDEFRQHISNVHPEGKIYYNLDDPILSEMVNQIGGDKFVSSSVESGADILAEKIELKRFGSEFDFIYRGNFIGRIELGVPGLHNISNSLGATALALDLGADFDGITSALRDFRGVGRRFQVAGDVDGVIVIDDYAHHPSEIDATIRAARNVGGERLIGVFQPHRFSRTRDLHRELARALIKVDDLVLTDIYSAFEEKIEGIDGRVIFDDAVEMGQERVTYCADHERIPEQLSSRVKSGDVVLIMGAGSIESTPDSLVKLLEEKNSEQRDQA
jgi:UDP-N-acetylmuramate--alanine ligase